MRNLPSELLDELTDAAVDRSAEALEQADELRTETAMEANLSILREFAEVDEAAADPMLEALKHQALREAVQSVAAIPKYARLGVTPDVIYLWIHSDALQNEVRQLSDKAADWTPEDVTALQTILNSLGYPLGDTGPEGNGVDGDWGPKTQAAFEELQSSLVTLGVLNATHAQGEMNRESMAAIAAIVEGEPSLKLTSSQSKLEDFKALHIESAEDFERVSQELEWLSIEAFRLGRAPDGSFQLDIALEFLDDFDEELTRLQEEARAVAALSENDHEHLAERVQGLRSGVDAFRAGAYLSRLSYTPPPIGLEEDDLRTRYRSFGLSTDEATRFIEADVTAAALERYQSNGLLHSAYYPFLLHKVPVERARRFLEAFEYSDQAALRGKLLSEATLSALAAESPELEFLVQMIHAGYGFKDLEADGTKPYLALRALGEERGWSPDELIAQLESYPEALDAPTKLSLLRDGFSPEFLDELMQSFGGQFPVQDVLEWHGDARPVDAMADYFQSLNTEGLVRLYGYLFEGWYEANTPAQTLQDYRDAGLNDFYRIDNFLDREVDAAYLQKAAAAGFLLPEDSSLDGALAKLHAAGVELDALQTLHDALPAGVYPPFEAETVERLQAIHEDPARWAALQLFFDAGIRKAHTAMDYMEAEIPMEWVQFLEANALASGWETEAAERLRALGPLAEHESLLLDMYKKETSTYVNHWERAQALGYPDLKAFLKAWSLEDEFYLNVDTALRVLEDGQDLAVYGDYLRYYEPHKDFVDKLILFGIEGAWLDTHYDEHLRGTLNAHALDTIFRDALEKGWLPEEVTRMARKYNLSFPSRYPYEMLEGMLGAYERVNETPKPKAVIFATQSDWNGAFEVNKSAYASLLDHYEVYVYEVTSDVAFVEAMQDFGKDFGKRSIELALIAGHGNQGAISFSTKNVGQSRQLDLYDGKRLRGLKRFMGKEATTVLISCSTGKGEDNIAKLLSKRLGTRVIAPSSPSNVSHFRFDETGQVEGVEYVDPVEVQITAGVFETERVEIN